MIPCDLQSLKHVHAVGWLLDHVWKLDVWRSPKPSFRAALGGRVPHAPATLNLQRLAMHTNIAERALPNRERRTYAMHSKCATLERNEASERIKWPALLEFVSGIIGVDLEL